MVGAYGGELSVERGRSRERAAAAIVERIRAALPGPVALEACVAILVTARDGALEYDADLEAFRPLQLDAAALPALADAARALAELHAAGRVHGDLRPAMLRVSGARAGLVVPPAGLDATALLAARLQSGAAPRDVAFAAPEVVQGTRADAGSDVYALAAMAFTAVTGRLPLGVVDARALLAPRLGEAAASTLARALGDAPRPDAATLAAALAGAELAEPAPPPQPYDGSSALAAVLAVGGIAAFVGALALVVTRWASFGPGTRLMAGAAFTAAMFAASNAAGRRGFARSALALGTLAAELLWADAWLVLAALERERSLGAWTAAAAAVGATQCALGAWRRSRVLGASATAALSVSAATLLWLVPGAWSPWAAPLAAGVAMIYAVLAFVARRLHSRPLAEPFAVGALVWLGASAIASFSAVLDGASAAWTLWPLALAAGCSPAAEYPLAGRAQRALIVATPALATLALQRDARLVHLTAAVALALFLSGARRLDKKGQLWSTLLAASVLLACAASAARALVAFAIEPGLWTALWPYALATGAATAGRESRALGVAATVLFSVTPATQALAAYRSPAFTAVAVAAGAAAFALAFARRAPQPDAVVVGVAGTTVAPCCLALAAVFGAELPLARWTYLATPPAVAAALLVVAVAGRARAQARAQHRAVEIAALAVFFGVPAVAMLPHPGSGLVFPAWLLGGGALALGAGVALRRSATVMTSAVVIVVELFVQYFARLGRSLPWGLTALGFGIALLALGALYERRLKALLPDIARWD